MSEKRKIVGRIRHHYAKIGVAVVDLTDDLVVGDEVVIEGATTTVKQKVESMQIEHKNVDTARAGQSIGLKVAEKVRENDNVYKLII